MSGRFRSFQLEHLPSKTHNFVAYSTTQPCNGESMGVMSGRWKSKPRSKSWKALDRRPIHAFLGKPQSARCADTLPMAISTVISRHERPCARRAATRAASTVTGGLPRRFPLARAFRRPAFTRSAIRLRSSSAMAPRTVKSSCRLGCWYRSAHRVKRIRCLLL
jgi:hypothetical protein